MKFRDIPPVQPDDLPRTIHEVIRARASETPDRIALLDGDRAMTFGELAERVAGLASQLRVLGVNRGDRIVMFVAKDSGIDETLLSIAAASTGTAAMLDASGPPAWRARMIERIRPRLVLLRNDLSGDGLSGAVVRYRGGPELLAPGDMGPATGGDPGEPGPEDIAFILASSGTTGEPKLAQIPHRMIAGLPSSLGGIGPEDRVLVIGAAYHALALMTHISIMFGASVLMGRLWPPSVLASLSARHRPTIAGGAPLLVAELGDQLAVDMPGDRTPFRLVLTAGAAKSRELDERLQRGFRCELVNNYSSTESFFTVLNGSFQADRTRIAGPDGEAVAPGIPGEIQAWGDHTFAGYLDDPEATAAAFTADGWVRTGDLGVIDETNRLRVLGRLAEIINRGGVKIAPEAIERAAGDHPAVAEAAAYPIPHPDLGHEAGLAVVLAPGAELSMRDLRRWLLERLPPVQMPHVIRVVDALPLTKSGKVARLLLAGLPDAGETDEPGAAG